MMIKEFAKAALINYGAILENWKIVIGEISQMSDRSDWVEVQVYVYKPRSKKPDFFWELCMNMARNVTDFGKSQFTNLK